MNNDAQDIFKEFDKNPISLFEQWLEEAKEKEINDPEAMCLATCDKYGQPHARMVLLKSFDEYGFKFHTNSNSQKGQDIWDNSLVELCFYWKSTRKQVRITGSAHIVDASESDAYFKTRPLGRQLGAWASDQSKPLEGGRKTLESNLEKVRTEYGEESIPRPPYWNGYRVKPVRMEFWIGEKDRLHDRFTYIIQKDGEWGAHWVYP